MLAAEIRGIGSNQLRKPGKVIAKDVIERNGSKREENIQVREGP